MYRLAVAIVLIASPSMHADLINFDEQPPAEYVIGSLYHDSGIFITSTRDVGGMFVEVSPGFAIRASDRAVSPPSLAVGNDPFLDHVLPDMLGWFHTPDNVNLGRSTTDRISLWVIPTQNGQNDPWTLVIFANVSINPFYDAYYNRLGVVTGVDRELVSFSRPEHDIGGFALLASSRREGIDDLSFTRPPAPLPEPHTIAIAVVALGLCFVFQGRRNVKKVLAA